MEEKKHTGDISSTTEWSCEDEIDLADLWKIIISHKWVILVVTFVFVVGGVVYSFSQRPVYMVSGIVKMGSSPGVRGSRSPRDEVVLLKEMFINGVKDYPRLVSAENRRGTNIIELQAEGYSKKSALSLLEKIANTIVNERNGKMLAYKRALESTMTELERSVNSLSKREKYLESILTGSETHEQVNGRYEKIFLALMRSNVEESINSITLEIPRIEMEILDIKEKLLSILPASFTVTSSGVLVRPRKGLIITLSVFVGLMVGVFLAFFLEYVSKQRSEK